MKRTLSFLLLLWSVCACEQTSFEEPEPFLSVGAREFRVPSDSPLGHAMLKDTLYVTSNRSWSASLPEDASWLRLDTLGIRNMSGVRRTDALVISFEDNEGDEDRTADLRLHCEGVSRTVKVIQESLTPRLNLAGTRGEFSSISSDGAKLSFSISCNTSWTAYVEQGSAPIVISLGKSSGKYSSEIDVVVGENEQEVCKDAVIVVSVDGLPERKWLRIPVTQLAGFPYFRLTDEYEDKSNPVFRMMDGIDNAKIGIKTNSSWTADISDINGFDIPEPSRHISGTKADVSALFRIPATSAIGRTASATVTFRADRVEKPVVVKISQRYCIRVSFGTLTSNTMWKPGAKIGMDESTWPFDDIRVDGETIYGSPYAYQALSGYAAVPGSNGNAICKNMRVEFVLKNGYSLFSESARGFWKNSTTGWMLGGNRGNYVELPAIPGFRLSEIAYTFRGTDDLDPFEFCFIDSAGNILPGTEEYWIQGSGTMKTFLLPGSVVGSTYRISANCTVFFYIGDLVLYFE